VEPFLAKLKQKTAGGLPIRHLKFGQVVAFARQVHLASFSDREGVADGFRYLGKEVLHLLRTAQVVGVIVHAHPVAVSELLARLDAEQDILQLRVIPPHIVHIVGRHQLCPSLFGKFDQTAVDAVELGNVVVL